MFHWCSKRKWSLGFGEEKKRAGGGGGGGGWGGECNTPKYTLFVFNMFRVFCRYKLKFL